MQQWRGLTLSIVSNFELGWFSLENKSLQIPEGYKEVGKRPSGDKTSNNLK